jgi:hypothetical protein
MQLSASTKVCRYTGPSALQLSKLRQFDWDSWSKLCEVIFARPLSLPAVKRKRWQCIACFLQECLTLGTIFSQHEARLNALVLGVYSMTTDDG